MYKYIKVLDLLKQNELITYDMVNVSNKALRMLIYRLRQKGCTIYEYRGRGYSLKPLKLLTNREKEILDILSDYELWTPEDISVKLYGDYNSYKGTSGLISRLRQKRYKIKSIYKVGYILEKEDTNG